MPTHFRGLQTHRRGILSVYRALIRHTTNLPLVNGVSEREASAIKEGIRDRFQRQKAQMSPFRVREGLKECYEIEENLRKLYEELDGGVLQELVSRSAVQVKERPPRDPKKTNRFGQPIKKDWANEQDLETQQIQNYVNRYVRLKQRNGLLPGEIDPEMLEHIIRPEALHHRAMMDVRIARRKVKSGAYKVHVTQSNHISFIRGPWRQSKRVSPMILKLIRQELTFFDYSHYWAVNKWLYDSEAQWERSIGHAGEGEPWGRGIAKDLKELGEQLDKTKLKYRVYAREKLPSLVQTKQQKSNLIHENIKRRYNALSSEMAGVTAFEEVLGRPTLRELVRKYRLRT